MEHPLSSLWHSCFSWQNKTNKKVNPRTKHKTTTIPTPTHLCPYLLQKTKSFFVFYAPQALSCAHNLNDGFIECVEMGVGWLIILHSRDFFNHPATKFPPQKDSYRGTGCEWDDNSVEFVHGSCWFRLFSWLNLGLNIYCMSTCQRKRRLPPTIRGALDKCT